jgi:hypothetical protein
MSPQIYILHCWPFLGFLSINSYGHQSTSHFIPTFKSHSYSPPTLYEPLNYHIIYHPDPQGILFSLVHSLFCTCSKIVIPYWCTLNNYWNIAVIYTFTIHPLIYLWNTLPLLISLQITLLNHTQSTALQSEIRTQLPEPQVTWEIGAFSTTSHTRF